MDNTEWTNCDDVIEERELIMAPADMLELFVSPVSADDYLDIRLSTGVDSEGLLSVIDSYGRIITSKQFIGNQLRLSTTEMENGYYIISYKAVGKVLQTLPFVVQH